jgi:hypothetical protein
MHLIVIGLVILSHGPAVIAAPIASLVQAAGLRAVDEPQPAADFQRRPEKCIDARSASSW